MGACLVLKLASPGLALPYGHGQQETRLRRRAILPLSMSKKNIVYTGPGLDWGENFASHYSIFVCI
jgi:hypothetical protein